ncbi:TetR/AcrR family transcriptional regulator [Kitasatospora terrestris]|uniref:HTH tetR-type domain-containing protein n=1 Tax=Kitasatospora terrestris TaxID=258051 RepID=A0ABP9EDN2_9ACTN
MSGGSGDPRAERTRAALRAALLAECERQPLDRVSVSALARRAGVGRATFYLHYEDLRALAVDACGEVVRDAVDALHAWRGLPDPAVPPPALVEFLTGAGERAALYRSLLTPGGGGPLGELMHRQLGERSRRERELRGAAHPDVVAAAVAATFTALLADWLHGRLPGSAADLAGHSWRLLIALHRAV